MKKIINKEMEDKIIKNIENFNDKNNFKTQNIVNDCIKISALSVFTHKSFLEDLDMFLCNSNLDNDKKIQLIKLVEDSFTEGYFYNKNKK